ncbi:hypothetical protein RMCBS344292_17230 [Rhizopus microsporus]|nr:hypothetical protein RMCBS344292_17230 [Rhizopus microsporus]
MESQSSSSQPPVALSKEVRDKLFLADFFDLEPPCDWNVIHYLNKLVQKNPAISARPGNKALYDDADLMLKHVVPGTVAETMLRQMTRSQMTATSKQIVSKFWKTKPTIASNKIEYDAQKKRM